MQILSTFSFHFKLYGLYLSVEFISKLRFSLGKPETLKETLKSIPSEMEPNINDWRLPVVDLKTMDARKLMNRRLRDVVEISQSMFAGNYDDLRNNRKIETESFMMAATFTRTKIKREDLPEGDEINMCEAIQEMYDDGVRDGMKRGIQQGRDDLLKEKVKRKLQKQKSLEQIADERN